MVTSAIELLFNLAMLVAMSLISGFIRQPEEQPQRHAMLQGLLFGAAALIGMLHPLVLGPGLIFDGRSVMISLCGLYFGPLAVAIAAAMALLYRIYLGGVGVYMGLLVIVASALWGLYFHRRWRQRALALTSARLLLLGLLVHVTLLLLMFTLPGATAIDTLQHLGLPILLAYPLVTLLIGSVLSSQEAALQAASALRESELRHRLLADNASDVIWTMNLQGRFTYVSPSVEKLRGYSSAEAMQQSLEQALCPGSIELASASLGQSITAIAAGSPFIEFRGELEQPCKDGSTVWTEVTTSGMRDGSGRFIGIVGVSRDITARKKAEAKALRLSQLYAALSQCNQAIVRCRSETELFTEVCRVAVTLGGMQAAWIGLVNPGSQQIEMAASFGDGLGYLAQLDLSVDAAKPNGQGLTGSAIRDNQPVWCQDFAREPRTAPWHECGARAGWAAAASLPIRRAGVAVGALLLYAAEVNAFDAAIRQLLIEMTSDISFAMDNFAREAARQQADERLRQSERSLKESQRIAGLGSYVLDIPSGHWSSSETLDQLFGIDQNYDHSVAGWAALIEPDDQAMMASYFKDQVLGQGKTFNKEYRIRRHDDQAQRWVHGLGELEFDARGQPLQMHGTIQDITERKQAESQIYSMAFYDPLTSLPNRQLLLDQLRKTLAAGATGQHPGALLFVDLDDFKTLNDARGHEAGDLLLQQVARRLSACVRELDTVARLSGDEFVVLLQDPTASAQEAARHAESVGKKILLALNQAYPLADQMYHSSASIGITLLGQAQENVEDPLKRAELAMYQAKAAGRNTLRFFDPQMQAAVTSRANLEAGLREALERQQFVLHYQAQVNAEHQVTGVEALVRWLDPERGIVAPGEFIGLAEETGLILPLGNWVLQAACQQLALWAKRPELAPLTVAVNVSAHQFHQSDFVQQVLDTLERTGANPQRLKLELTESMLVSNIEDVVAKMNALKDQGVGFSLDDFGTGYSSLSYLKRLPLDQLKIDQGFVRNILIDPNDVAIAKMVVALANSMGLTAIAEGVETEPQRALLASLGCHAYQGYLFSRPLPLAQFEAFALRA